MTDILFGNNNRPVLKLLAKRSLKARRNTIAVLAILLATLLFTSLFTIAILSVCINRETRSVCSSLMEQTKYMMYWLW